MLRDEKNKIKPKFYIKKERSLKAKYYIGYVRFLYLLYVRVTLKNKSKFNVKRKFESKLWRLIP